MWFWFVIPSSTKVKDRDDEERRDSNPPKRGSDQPETNKKRRSEQESNEPQQTEPETNKQRHSEPESNKKRNSEPESNKAQQSKKQSKRKITIPSPEVLPILKPEVLCVGFIGLLHNGCWFFILAYYFVYWAFAVDHMVKGEKDDSSSKDSSSSSKDNSTTEESKKDDSNKDDPYEYERLKFTKGLAIACIILHLIGLILTGFALRMDHLLRYSADPAMEVYKVARILQHYVVVNTVFVIYAVIMFFIVVCFYIPPEYKYIFIGLMLGSICLRMVCADIVERYLILLAKLAGIKTLRICFCSPRRNEEAKTAPSDHEQQV